MIQNLVQLVSHYLDIDEFYEIKSCLDLDINLYLKNAKCPTRLEKSYSHYRSSKFAIHDFGWACYTGYLDVVKFMFSKNIKSAYIKPMSIASARGHLEIVKFLNINLKKRDKEAPMQACYNNQVNILRYLHEEDKLKAHTFFHLMYVCIVFGSFDCAKYLESKNIFMIDDDFKTEIIWRVKKGHPLEHLANLDKYLGENNLGNVIKSKLDFSEKIKNIITKYLV